MRILIDITGIGQGGAERQVIGLANGLERRGHRVLLVVHKTVEAYQEDLLNAAFAVIECRRQRIVDPRVTWDIVKLIRAFGPDVCITEGYNASLWGRAATALTGVPNIQAEHATRIHSPWKIRAAHRMLGFASQRIVACSHAQVPSLMAAGVREERIAVICNGVDSSEFYPATDEAEAFRAGLGIPARAFVIGLVAAHRREKRHDRFIQLVELLSRRGLDAYGLMVGGGERLSETCAMAERSSAHNRLVVAGRVADGMRAAYCAMDVAVLVSDDVESFPLCFVEAQACGRPVVGMDVGGVRETFEEGTSGFLVRQGDLPGMAAVLERLAKDHQAYVRLAAGSRRVAQARHSHERMIADFEALLAQCVATALAG